MKRNLPTLAAAGLMLFGPSTTIASEKVTVDTFVRAETDMTMGSYVRQGAFGKFLHIRQPTPIDKQKVIRMNRDTIYSIGVFDLTEPVTIVKPDSKGRFQSMQVINQDHYTLAVEYDQGEYTFTKEKVGTRYLCILIRTFVDASDSTDIKAANELQNQIAVRQKSAGTFEIPEWDEASLTKVRDAINVLAATRSSAKGMFGSKNEVDPISHLLGTAYGWGGNPDKDATYINVVPEKNDGKTPYVMTVSEKVPVDGFVSITVYNAKGFMEKNDLDAYSVNNVTAKKNADGSVTVHLGGDPAGSNYLPITPGWNYIVRMYRPKPEILDGAWIFPKALPAAPDVLSDGANAKHKRVDNMHQTRYIEIFLSAKNPKTGGLVAACYNTMFMPQGIPASKDTAPQALVEGLDFDQIKKTYGVLGASLNGPKLWLPDWTEIDTGVIRAFNGIKAPWVAQLDMGGNTGGVSESASYKPKHIDRKSGVGWNKGTLSCSSMILMAAHGS